MWFWSVLEIEPTDDARSIKRAYSKLLRKTRPDEDKEGFQRLHTAYQDALEWAKFNTVETTTEHSEESEHSAPFSEPESDESNNASNTESVRIETSSKTTQDTKATAVLITAEHEPNETLSNDLDDAIRIEQPLQKTQETPPVETIRMEDIVREKQTASPEDVATITLDASDTEHELNNTDSLGSTFYTQDDVEQFAETFADYFNQHALDAHMGKHEALLNHSILRDYDHRQTIGYRVFEAVQARCCQYDEADKHEIIGFSANVSNAWLRALDTTFNWLEQRTVFETYYDLNAVDFILDSIEHAKQNLFVLPVPDGMQYTDQMDAWDRKLMVIRRAIAFGIDVFMITVGFALFSAATKELIALDAEHRFNQILVVSIIYLVYFSWLESRKKLNTIGKMILKVKVLNRYGNPPSLLHAFVRTWISATCLLFSKITLWANAFFFSNQLIQDKLSQTYFVTTDYKATQ